MTNRLGSLDIDIWDFIGIWCLEFEISEYLNTRDSVTKDDLSIGYHTVKFHSQVEGLKRCKFKGSPPRRDNPFRVERLKSCLEPGTLNH